MCVVQQEEQWFGTSTEPEVRCQLYHLLMVSSGLLAWLPWTSGAPYEMWITISPTKTLSLLLPHMWSWALFMKAHRVFPWFLTAPPPHPLWYCWVIRLGPLESTGSLSCVHPLALSNFRCLNSESETPSRNSANHSLVSFQFVRGLHTGTKPS